MLKIRVMNVTKKDLQKTLKRFKGASWDQSPVFKKLYEEEYGQLGGEPFVCVVNDFYFDHSPQDVETLGELAKIGAACHAPMITAAAPTLFGWSLAGARQSARPDQDLLDPGVRRLAFAA